MNNSFLCAIVAGCVTLLCMTGCTKEFAGESEAGGSQADRRARAEKFLKQFETKSGDFLTEEEKAFLLSDLEDVRIIRLVSVKRKDATKSAMDFEDDCFIEIEDSLVFETADADTSAQDWIGFFAKPEISGHIESGKDVEGKYDAYINNVEFKFEGLDMAQHTVKCYFGRDHFSASAPSGSTVNTPVDDDGGRYHIYYSVSSGKGDCVYNGTSKY